MLTVLESPRWLVKKGRYDEAWKSLSWYRGSDGPEVQQEMDEMRAGIALEMQQTEGFTLMGESDQYMTSSQMLTKDFRAVQAPQLQTLLRSFRYVHVPAIDRSDCICL
jgi:hypothetical protein